GDIILKLRRRHSVQKRDHRREVRVGSDDRPDPAQPPPESAAIRREEYEQIREALHHLPEEWVLIIRWHVEERLTFAKIGKRLGRTAEAVHHLWSRGIRDLRAMLAD